jgi:hypothetical protein
MAGQKKQREAYDFLREHALSSATFTTQDLATHATWSLNATKTYLSKQFNDFIETDSSGAHRVSREFRRVGWDEFRELVTQVRRSLVRYLRATYQAVVVYDFLMPLTREDKLRKALNDLFYRESLESRIREVGLDALALAIPRNANADDLAYIDTIVNFVDKRIGGFSVSHVSGRFRTGPIVSRPVAGQFAHDHPYLVDETTAVVRFIIPCLCSKTTHDGYFDFTDPDKDRSAAIRAEVQQIRTMFFELFVEALVPTIRGEQLIWMVETTPAGQRLYELTRKSKGAARGPEDREQDDDHESDGSEASTGT